MYSINKKKPINIRKYLIYPVTEGIVLALVALFLTAVTAFFIYHHALKSIRAEIKDGLLRTASGIAACLDGDLIASYDSPEKSELESYKSMLKLLQKARLATKHCTYLYVNKLQGDKVFFILDPTPIDENGKPLFSDEINLAPSIPMTEYKEPSQELIQSLKEQTKVVSDEPYTDQWGTFYSAYVPIFDRNKKFVGTLGADLRIDDMLARCEPILDATKRAFFVAFILAILCGTLIWFARRFSLQLNESRFHILANFLDASEFADQTAEKIGKQLQRTGLIFKNVADRIKKIRQVESQNDLQGLLKDEEDRLSSFAQKLAEAGEFKFIRRETELDDFSIPEAWKNVKKSLAENQLDSDKIEFEIDKNIPAVIFGAAKTYEELLAQMCSFYLKMFSSRIKCEVLMTREEAKDVFLIQKMTADLSALEDHKIKLLEHLSQEADKEEFFTEIELAEAASIPILRELIYLFNSDIGVAIVGTNFEISFECLFKKSKEDESEDEHQEAANN